MIALSTSAPPREKAIERTMERMISVWAVSDPHGRTSRSARGPGAGLPFRTCEDESWSIGNSRSATQQRSTQQDRAEERMTETLAARAVRAAERQLPLRGAVDELPALVAAAHQAGMPAERTASCARITSEDVRRVLDTGRLY